MRGVRILAAGLVLALLAAAGARAAPPVATAESDRWRVTSEGTEEEARELVRVLDAAWPQFESFFGAAPKLGKGERLLVRFFETADAMKAAIVAGGGSAPDAGGYYCPVARTSYAFRQPSRWYTRTLVIHEAAHQFQLRGAAAKAKAPPPAWWQEGCVEHLSHHTWDGTALRLGVVPPVSLEDRPAAALDAAKAPGWAPEKVAEAALDRPQAMHVVRWMATGDGGRALPRWKDLQRRLDSGESLKPRDLASAFGGAATLHERFAAWLPTVQQPFVSCFVEWDSTGPDSLRGSGAAVAACRTRGPAASISAKAAPRDPSAPWRAGLLLRWAGPDDYVVAQVEGGVRWFADRRRGGAWERLAQGDLAGGASPWRLSAVREAGAVVFRVGETEARIPDGDGPLGLCLEGCTVDFTDVRVR